MNSLKHILVLVTIVASLCVVAGAQTENQIELKVQGVGLGSERAAVVSRLGKPVRQKLGKAYVSECTDSRETTLTLNYPGLVIELVGDGRGRNFTVATITLTSDKWAVAPGITIGTNTNAITAQFPTPVRTETEAGTKRMIYFHRDGGATFSFRANKLVKIEWGLDRC